MSIEIIPIYKNLDEYVAGVENNTKSTEILWNKYAIEPYWDLLCQYAPYDLSEVRMSDLRNRCQIRTYCKYDK